MPTTVSLLLKSAGIDLFGTVKWGDRITSQMPGIYIVSLSPEPNMNAGTLSRAPVSLDAVRLWIDKIPQMELDSQRNPSPEAIVERLSKYWLPDENILYIGMTTKNLAGRIEDYYHTELGDRRPHAGGCWIKTLVNVQRLNIYFAECPQSESKIIENRLLKVFVDGVSGKTRSGLYDPEHPFPYANLEYPKGITKRHGIRKSKR